MSTTCNMRAQRVHDVAGDVRALMREHLPPEVEAELVAAEQHLSAPRCVRRLSPPN